MTAAALAEDRLVAHLAAQAAQPPDDATRRRVAQALLDWCTAGWSGAEMPLAAAMRQTALDAIPGPGPAPIFGAAGPVAHAAPLAAACANAAIAHLREIDDAHRAAMLHPGVVAVTPVLALASGAPMTQRQLLAGIVAGYEVALRVGEALGTRHAALFHATATAGCLGAAAATAVALGLSPQQLHHALGIAATQSAGLWQLVDDEAHESKSLHPAFAVRNGMMAAWAARAGLPGARALITGKRGLYALLAGDGPLAAIDGGLDAPARIHTTTIKAWPACAQLFTPLDAMQALISEHGLRAQDIETIDVLIFPHALKIAGVGWPTKTAETPFSLRYVLAALLANGRLGIDEMERPLLNDAALQVLAGRIRVATSDAFQQLFPERRPAQVTVTLTGGQQLSARRDLRRGDPEDPFSWDQLQQRMRAFAPEMSDAAAARITSWCERVVEADGDERICGVDEALFGGPQPLVLRRRSP